MEKFRSKKFCILLYPEEDPTHKKALEYIKLNYDYASIVHDQDVNEQGELKKSHTHVVISMPNAKWNTALAKELGITENYLERCRSLENALEYLIHFNDDSKHQYTLEQVKGNLKKKLEKIMLNDGKDEEDKVQVLVDFIMTYKGYLRVTDFSYYCLSMGMWSVYRRSSAIFGKLIEEHNKYVKQID